MNTRYLLGAAAVALFAATGAARAADVMPIVVSVTPTVPPVVVGPMITVQIEAGTYLYIEPQSYWSVGTGFDGEVDVKSASGWGFHLVGGAGVSFPGPNFYYGATAELYRIIGNAEVGFAVGTGGSFGPTFRYETDRFEFAHQTYIEYLGAGDWDTYFENLLEVTASERLTVDAYAAFGFGFFGTDLDIGIEVDFEPSDRLEIEAWAWADLINNVGAGVGGQLKLTLGPLSPYVGAELEYFGMGPDLEFWAGVELERPIGTGPFTLTGDAGVEMNLGGTPEFYAGIGIRYNLGDRDNIRFLDDGS